MGIITLVSYIVYRKKDNFTTIAISLLIILMKNPFLITSSSVLLSYGGTIGIIIFSSNIFKILKRIRVKNRKYKYRINKNIIKFDLKIKEVLSITIAVQICIIPIMLKLYNTLNLSVIITSILLTCIIGIIIILSFTQIMISFINIKISEIIAIINTFFLKILIQISQLGNILPLSKVYIQTPKIEIIILYYFIILLINYIIKLKSSRNKNSFQNRMINLYYLFKYLVNRNKLRIFKLIIFVLIILSLMIIIPRDLRIYFVDVNQGDCTLIKTPNNKTVLIDGGGSITSDYDIGKNILIPYLLERKIKRIDYMIVSHVDNDHIRRFIDCYKRIKSKTGNNRKTI